MIVVCVEVKWSSLTCVTVTCLFVTSLLFSTSIVQTYVLVVPESAIALTIVGVKRVKLQVLLQVKLR